VKETIRNNYIKKERINNEMKKERKMTKWKVNSYINICYSEDIINMYLQGRLRKPMKTHSQEDWLNIPLTILGPFSCIHELSLLHVLFLPSNSAEKSFDASTSLLERGLFNTSIKVHVTEEKESHIILNHNLVIIFTSIIMSTCQRDHVHAWANLQ
jgi:hypothetical protein